MPNRKAEDVIALFDEVRSRYGNLLKQFKEDEALINAAWTPGFGSEIVPDDWEDDGLDITVPPTVYNAVENASDHILTVPKITVPLRPVKYGIESARQHAEDTRQFLELFWHRVFEDSDPLGKGKKSLVKGKLVIKHEFRWDLLPELPEDATPSQKRKYRRQVEGVARNNFMWRERLIPKETVFEDPANPDDPEFVFESYQIMVMDARSLYADNEAVIEALKDKSATSMVSYTEYWSKPHGDEAGQYIGYVERMPIFDEENPYGYVPYAIVNPGWGDETAERNPEDLYVSIVRPIRSVGNAEIRFVTEMESYLRMYIWPHLITRNMPDLEDGEKQVRLGPGGHNDLTEEQNVEVLKFGEMPVSLLQGMERVNQYADEASRFGALGGTPQRGVDTATEADQNFRNAATKLSGPLRALQRLVQRINTWVLMDIEELGVPVTMYGAIAGNPAEVTLTARSINGFYYTSVELDTTDAAALNLRNARTWSDLYQRLPISAYKALKEAGVANPNFEIDQRTIEDLERSPQAAQILLMTMLGGFGEIGRIVQQGLQNQILGADVGGGGVPGSPPPQQPAAPDAVQAMRGQARQDAYEAAPERAFY